ncbi:cation:proton antiporter [Streptomyces iranensis]|uniref:Kef-type K+ transport system membrane component KefB n=1 Tax=Streptomyces iranensis TaxID=576784 RepID=A0A060ZTG4_9ACTN|nr:cation:proton antiporter [Streptomyces iranensis]MBP2060881.1 Kef-type K+ transport system membrane component KefB [Streptomyces iranensis]CDR06342.1 sodium/hydrogen exchanger [Streptomyces iranensis]
MAFSLAPTAPIGAHQLLLFLLQVGTLLLLATLLGRLAIQLRMPAIVGELCTGVLVGPSVLSHAAPAVSHWLLPNDPAQFHLLDAAGQLGVLMLIGLTGVELDAGALRRNAPAAAGVSAAGILVPLGLGVCAGFVIPASLMAETARRPVFALFLGVAMGISAMPVIAKALIELRLIHHEIGRLIMCAVVVDDTVGWILLSVVSAMATTGIRAGAVLTSMGWLVVVLVMVLLVRRPVGAGLRAVDRGTRDGTSAALAVAFILLCAAATQAMGLEAVFGAFVGGVVVGGWGRAAADQLAAVRTTTLTILAPLFFATAGLRIDLSALAEPVVLATGVVLLLVATTGKFAGAYVGGRLSRLGHWESLAIGAGMNARGVIEVVVAMAGLRLGVLSPDVYTIVVLVAIATSLMAPPVLRFAMARAGVSLQVMLPEKDRSKNELISAAE